jgi:hypothetical protein
LRRSAESSDRSRLSTLRAIGANLRLSAHYQFAIWDRVLGQHAVPRQSRAAGIWRCNRQGFGATFPRLNVQSDFAGVDWIGADFSRRCIGASTPPSYSLASPGEPQRRRSFSLGTAAVSAGAPESELTRHLKEMNFLSAHRSSYPIWPATQSVSPMCFDWSEHAPVPGKRLHALDDKL